MKICLLHGFLGQESDWGLVKEKICDGLLNTNKKAEYISPSLFSDDEHIGVQSFEVWSKLFVEAYLSSDEPIILVGYSLGGRLAQNLLQFFPHKFKKVFLLSTNVKNQLSEQSRLDFESYWGNKFLVDPWDDLMSQWNELEIFNKTSVVTRNEQDYSRKKLSQAFSQWSLVAQKIDLKQLAEVKDKIVWLTGSTDLKYTQLLLKQHWPGKKQIISKCGHRLHLDAAAYIAQLLVEEIKKA